MVASSLLLSSMYNVTKNYKLELEVGKKMTID